MGERALSIVQYGIEATAGVPVPATRMALKVVEAMGVDRVPSFPEEDFGARAKALRSWIGQHLVEDTLTFEEAYFEMLPFVFSCGLVGGVTATTVATGTGANKTYGWHFPVLMKAVNNPDSFTLEKADDVVNYECDYGMFERINIKGTVNQGGEVSAVTVTNDFFAREWTSSGATALVPIEVFAINAKLATLDIDPLWASLGTTPMTESLRAFDIDILTGLHPKMLGSANKHFDIHAEGIIHVTSAFTFEGNALASTEYGHFLTQTDRAYRLTVSNPASAASHGAASMCQIDVFGRWREVIPFADEDRGNNLFTLIHESILDPTDFAATPDMLEVFLTVSTGAV
jgi:hypothetical protein